MPPRLLAGERVDPGRENVPPSEPEPLRALPAGLHILRTQPVVGPATANVAGNSPSKCGCLAGRWRQPPGCVTDRQVGA